MHRNRFRAQGRGARHRLLTRLLVLIPLGTFAASSEARAQAPATADTAADGSITYTTRQSESLDLSPEEKIRELNLQILKNPTDGDLYNDLGVVYANLEDWPTARDAFIRAVQAKPTEADFHRNLGLVFVELGDYALAVGEFRAYQRFSGGSPDAWQLIGNAHRAAGELEEARRVYREGIDALGEAPSPARLRLMVALVGTVHDTGPESRERELLDEFYPYARRYLEHAAAEESEEGVDQAQVLVDNRLALLIADAELMNESGLYREAAAAYERVLEMAPDRDEVYPRLVDAYLEAGETMQARVKARLARENHPEAAGAWVATGKVYEHLNRTEEAVDAYVRAREIDPDLPGIDMAIGQLYLKLDRVADARRYLNRVVNDPATPPAIIYNYGVSLMKDQKYTAAIDPLRRATERRPDWPQAWAALASSLRLAGRYAAAIGPYEKAFELAPDAKLAFALGVCANKAGDTAGAVSAYQQALALDPRYVEARYNLSLVFMEAERYAEAVTSFDALLELEPDSYRALFSQGRALYHLGRYDDALDKYEKALEQRETANVYNAIGLVYDKLGDKKAAKEYYDEAKRVQAGN